MTTTTFPSTLPVHYTEQKLTSSLFAKFNTWCRGQQTNRLLWLGIIVAGHGCAITPMVLLTVVATSNHFFLFMAAMVAMAAALVTNLAAMPTKITLP